MKTLQVGAHKMSRMVSLVIRDTFTDEQLERIAKVPKRELMRRGINQHTLEKICRKKPVRALKLEACLRIVESEASKCGRQTSVDYYKVSRNPRERSPELEFVYQPRFRLGPPS
jgi:hypothetical protein